MNQVIMCGVCGFLDYASDSEDYVDCCPTCEPLTLMDEVDNDITPKPYFVVIDADGLAIQIISPNADWTLFTKKGMTIEEMEANYLGLYQHDQLFAGASVTFVEAVNDRQAAIFAEKKRRDVQ